MIVNFDAFYMRGDFFRRQKIIDSPTYIPLACRHPIAPPRIVAGFTGVKLAKNMDKISLKSRLI
jgi:hypothetical protein